MRARQPATGTADRPRPHLADHRPGNRHPGTDRSVVDELVALTSSGEGLPDGVRRHMETVLGHDLRTIRIHRDERAADLAEEAGAEAVTIGAHIWFGAPFGDLTTPVGRRRLLHELAHSRLDGGVPAPPLMDDAGPASAAEEAAAERIAESAEEREMAVPHAAIELPGGPISVGRKQLPAAPEAARATPWTVGGLLAGLIDRLLRRDPDDRSGRVRAVAGRLAEPLRQSVARKAAEGTGARWSRLESLLGEHAPTSTAGAAGVDGETAAAPADHDAAGAAPPPGMTTTEAQPAADAVDGAPATGTGQPDGEPASAAATPKVTGATEKETDEPPQPPQLAGAAPATEQPTNPPEPSPAESGPSDRGGAPPAMTVPAAGGSAAGDAPAGAATEDETAAAIAPSLTATQDDDAPADPDDAESAAEPDADDAAGADADGHADAPVAELGGSGPEAPADDARPPADPGQDAGPGDLADASSASPAAEEPTVAAPAPAPTPAPAPAGAVDPGDDPAEQLDGPATDGETGDGAPDEGAPDEGAGEPGDATGGNAAAAPGDDAGAPADAGSTACSSPPLAPMEDAPGGGACSGGGGGGGGAAPDATAEQRAPEAATVDGAATDPAAGVGAVASLKATRRPAALAAAQAAATSQVTSLNDELASAPPSVERPSGGPASKDTSIPPAKLPQPTAGAAPAKPELPAAGTPTIVQPAAPPAPGASPTNAVRMPSLSAAAEMSAAEVTAVRDGVSSLPTTDRALDVDAGPIPTLTLDGAADPARVTTQAADLVTSTTALQTAAAGHVVHDYGDRDIYPTVKPETLVATIAPSTPNIGGGAASADTGKVPAVVIDRVAEDDQGDAPRTKIEAQQQAMVAGKAEQETKSAEARDQAKVDLDKAVADNGQQQATTRTEAARAADASRQSWVDENAATATKTSTMATAATNTADRDARAAQGRADTEAKKQVTDANGEITTIRGNAERDAAEKKREAERESDDGGFFSWVKSKVHSFFNKIKDAIKGVFDAARSLVDKAIKGAQALAVAAIELGRKAANAAIELGGKALVLAGDVVLAGFPDARKKWESTINDGVERSKAAVNELADDLKTAAVAILDALGTALKGVLSALEFVYTKALEAVEAVVQGVIDAAKAVAEAFGDFLEIAIDVASGPLDWLGKLGSSVMDGVKNCTWPALKLAVKTWFKEKVEEVVGVGRTIMDILVKGCISFAQIAKMAWAAIKESLPGIIIQLLIEKLVAMLIPAAGALSLIIDGLRAAWGAASRILQAFKRFVAFLKAVKTGAAGPQFGSLVGAAATAVLDFVANFVLVKLKGAGQKVGGVLKKMAAGIGKALKKVATVAKKVVKAVVSTAKRGAGVVARGAKRVVKAVGAGAKRVLRAAGRTRIGRAVIGAAKKTIAGGKKLYGKGKDLLEKRRQRKAAAKQKQAKKQKETPQQKLTRVVGIIKPQIERWRAKGSSNRWFRGKLFALGRWHRLSSLTVSGAAGQVEIVAKVNPSLAVTTALIRRGEALRRMIHEVAREMYKDEQVRAQAQAALRAHERASAQPGGVTDMPTGTGGVLGFVRSLRQRRRDRRRGDDRTRVDIGGGRNLVIHEHRDRSATRYNRILRGLGRYVHSDADAPRRKTKSILDRFKTVASGQRMSDAQLAGHLQGFGRTGKVDQGSMRLGTRRFLARTGMLMFGRESARNTANPVLAAMTTQMMASGQMHPEDAFGSQRNTAFGGGDFPMSMEGAQGAAAELQRERGAGPEVIAQRSDAARELARREIDLAVKWLLSKMELGDGEVVPSDEELKKIIRREMGTFYGLALKGPVASSAKGGGPT